MSAQVVGRACYPSLTVEAIASISSSMRSSAVINS
jgi:hypothetical protein